MKNTCLYNLYGNNRNLKVTYLNTTKTFYPFSIVKFSYLKYEFVILQQTKNDQMITYLDVEDMDPAVILLECWSTNTCKPIVSPIFAKWMPSSYGFCCFSLISCENSESFKIFLWLNEQQIPMSVGTGLKILMQSISLPYKRHFSGAILTQYYFHCDMVG